MSDNLLDGGDQPNVDLDKDYLEELIGPNGKFYDPDRNLALQKLAKGKVISDTYITTLERQKDELRDDYLKVRDEYNAGPKLQELLDQLKAQQTSPRDNQEANVMNQPTAIDLSQVESLVSNKIQEYELTQKQNENFKLVKDKLTQRYGDNHQSAVKQQIANLGITEARLNEMARSEPQVLIRALGLDQAVSGDNFQAPPQSNRRSDNFAPSSQKRDWNYYQKLKRDNPKVYHDPKTSVQMHNDVLAAGEKAFYGE